MSLVPTIRPSNALVEGRAQARSVAEQRQAEILRRRSANAAMADADEVAADLTAHEAAPDPHPQYLTEAEGDAAYDALGAAAAAVSTHEGLSDPHPQYLTAAEGSAAYEPVGAVAAHVAALDPHAQYLKESDATAANIANTPAGTIAATTVQGAIDELGSEKVAKAGDTMTGALQVPAGSAASFGLAVGGTAAGLYNASGALRLGSGNSGALTVGNNNLMVGYADGASSTSGTRLQVYHTGNNFMLLESDTGELQYRGLLASADAVGVVFRAQKARGGSLSSMTAIQQNDVALDLLSQGHDGSVMRNIARQRFSAIASSPGPGDMEGRDTLHLTPASSVTLAEMRRFDHATGFSMFGANPVIDQNRIHRLRSYTVATLPAAGTAGRLAYCSNEASGAMPVYDNGTNWIDIINGTTAA